jgi:hypothetical protein
MQHLALRRGNADCWKPGCCAGSKRGFEDRIGFEKEISDVAVNGSPLFLAHRLVSSICLQSVLRQTNRLAKERWALHGGNPGRLKILLDAGTPIAEN